VNRRIDELLSPCHDLILVRRQLESEYASSRIIAPERTRAGRSTLGQIVKAGPLAGMDYVEGSGVVMGVYAGTAVAHETADTSDVIWIVAPSEIKAFWEWSDDVEGLPTGTLPESLVSSLTPKATELLVERLEMPQHRSGIILPSGSMETKRAAEAVVVAVGAEVYDFDVGDKVLLDSSALRSIEFGPTSEKTLWTVVPRQILCRLNEFPEDGKLMNRGEHGMANYQGDDIERYTEDDGKLPEGDPTGLL